jgi:hypothetical protein
MQRLIVNERGLVTKIIHLDDELPPKDARNDGTITTPVPSKQNSPVVGDDERLRLKPT